MNDLIQVAPDNPSGKKVQTFSSVVGANTVHAQAVVLVDQFGNPISVVQKQSTYPTPTTLNTVIACLQAAGLCA